MRKTCFKCGLEKPLAEFYRHPMMGDGHLGKCKECTKRDVSENYRANIAHYIAYEIERNQRPERRIAAREYGRRRQPHKKGANVAVSNAVRAGRLVPKPCEVCGSVEVQAHHDDYSKPLDVRWLCFEHHMAHHGKKSHGRGKAPVRLVRA